MNNRLTYAAAAVLTVHGIVHFLGPVAYLELATVEELPYKTTLFDGAVGVGDAGIRLFGLLWAVAGLGFIGVAAGLVTDWTHWRSSLVGVTLVSLVLTVADYTVAYASVVVNLIILIALVSARGQS